MTLGPLCGGCPLQPIGSGFVREDGEGTEGVLAIAEAAGEVEAREGKPLVGPAGKHFQRILNRTEDPDNPGSKLERSMFRLANVISCFKNPRTSVLTLRGYQELTKVTISDSVLTHMGRWRRVTALLHGRENEGAIKVVTPLMHHIVTPEHLFWTGSSWIQAQDLQSGDTIRYLKEVCVNCGLKFLRRFKQHSMAFCSKLCHNKWAALKGVAKLREVMLEAYQSGKRDRFEVTRAANAAVREMAAKGEWNTAEWVSAEGRASQRLKASLAREALGIKQGLTWIGEGEKEIADILESQGVDYTSQFSLDGYNYDFRLGSLLLEVDGKGKGQEHYDQRRELKAEVARRHGFSVAYVPWYRPVAVLDILQNDAHEFEFGEIEVKSVTEYKMRKGAWSLAVEEDESFVAQGVVNHNCRPPNNLLSKAPYEVEATKHCSPYLIETIERFKPKVILAMGGTAFKWFTGIESGIERLRGYVFPTKYGPVIGTFHPSHLIRQGRNEEGAKGKIFLSPVVQFDILKALHIARHGLIQSPKKHYILHPSYQDVVGFRDSYFAALKEDPSTILFLDIETPRGKGKKDKDDDLISIRAEDDPSFSCIFRISFSFKPHYAITIPWVMPFLPIIREILASMGPKGAHNEQFDSKRLAFHGAPVNGRMYCSLQAFHFLRPHLPLSLSFIVPYYVPEADPWKLEVFEQPELYSCKDSEYGLQVILGILRELDRQGKRALFERHVVDILQVLRKIGARGVRTNPEKRAEEREKFKLRLEGVVRDLQSSIPLDLKPKRIFKIKKEALLKKGYDFEADPSRWMRTPQEVPDKEGWMVNEAMDALERIPKEKKPRKRRAGKGTVGDVPGVETAGTSKGPSLPIPD